MKTNRERAIAALDGIQVGPFYYSQAIIAIERALDEAVVEERESCASTVNQYGRLHSVSGYMVPVADLIRARGAK